MTDKERILAYIIQRFYSKYILGMDNRNMELFNKCNDEAIKVGDLVIAQSSGVHNFTVGFVTNIISLSNMVIREIGSNKTCNISNEQFYKIDTEKLDKNELLEGIKYEIYKKVLKVVNHNEYCIEKKIIMFGDVEFNDNMITVYLREKWHEVNKESGLKFSFKYNSKTTLKFIKEEMIRQCS